MSEENKVVFRRWVDALNARSFDGLLTMAQLGAKPRLE
jgi:hypothetical protein